MDKSADSEYVVEDSENLKGSEALGIKAIAMEQYRRCCVECSKEMSKGGIQRKVVNGVETLIEIPNQQEIFINTVRSMECVLVPEFLTNPQLYAELEQINKDITSLDKEFETEQNKILNTHKSLLSQCPPERFARNIEEKTPAILKALQNRYDSQKVILFQKKFVVISKLLKEINYFESTALVG